jgi:TfoX/Sxy family transcriptional regulator of competence genes
MACEPVPRLALVTSRKQTSIMQLPKTSEEQKHGFRDLLGPLTAGSTAVEVKPMFGQLAAFVNGNMFAGLFGSAIGVKLDKDDAAELAAAGGGPFGPPERPMGGYLTVPPEADAADWTRRAVSYVACLPPKTANKTPNKTASKKTASKKTATKKTATKK